MSIDFSQTDAPALDSPEGARWMQGHLVRERLTDAGESTAVIDAFAQLLDAFRAVSALHDGNPDGTSRQANVLAYLDRLTGHEVYGEGVKGLPRISNPPLCSCGHGRGQHHVDPLVCVGCREEDGAHKYTAVPA